MNHEFVSPRPQRAANNLCLAQTLKRQSPDGRREKSTAWVARGVPSSRRVTRSGFSHVISSPVLSLSLPIQTRPRILGATPAVRAESPTILTFDVEKFTLFGLSIRALCVVSILIYLMPHSHIYIILPGFSFAFIQHFAHPSSFIHRPFMLQSGSRYPGG